MKLFLLGSTGKAGSSVLPEALQRGHHVTVLVRTPEKVVFKHKNLTILEGDVLDPNALATALPGHDAVISCLSPGTIKRTDLQKRFAKCITEAMLTVGVQRLVILSVAFLFDDAGIAAAIFGNTLFRNNKIGAAEMEEVIRNSGLEWTIVRLPRLVDSPSPTEYHVRAEHMPPAMSITNRSLARFLLDEVEQNRYVHTTVGVSA